MWLIFCVTIVTVLCFRGAVRRVGNNLKTRRRPYRVRDDGVIPGRAVPTTLPVAALADGVSIGAADDSVIGRNQPLPCAVPTMLSGLSVFVLVRMAQGSSRHILAGQSSVTCDGCWCVY